MTETAGGRLTPGEIQHRATRGALWTGLQAVISLPLNVASTVVIARTLGTSGYGELAFFTVIFLIAQQVTDLGYTSSAVQWGSAARVEGDDVTLRRQLSDVTGFHVLFQGPLILAASLVILREAGPAYGVAYGVGAAFMLYVSCASLGLVLDQRNDLLAKIAVVTNIATQCSVIAATIVTSDALSVLVARGWLGALPGLGAALVLRKGLRRAALRPRFNRSHPPGFWRFALFSWTASCVALLVYSRSEILVLESLSTAAQTGLFALAYGVSTQLTGPVDALIAPLVPATAGLVSGHSHHVARAIRRALSLSSLLVGLLLAAATPALYALFPTLYGDDFATAGDLFLALAIMSSIQTATNVLNHLLQANRDGKRLLSVNAIALVANLLLAVALIPHWGAWGALIANSAGQLVSVLLIVHAAAAARNGIPLQQILGGVRPWFAALPGLAAGLTTVVVLRTFSDIGAAAAGGVVGVLLTLATMRITQCGPAHDDAAALTNALPRMLQRPTRVVLQAVSVR